ncbi:MAG: DUF3048 domain-containing protein [Chloroflexi bacterium]|nr:DUF3048 domain-containing protein [Chloroflexota bacterium]
MRLPSIWPSLAALLLVACVSTAEPSATSVGVTPPPPDAESATPVVAETSPPTSEPTDTIQATVEPTATQELLLLGPDEYSEGINPLTGLPFQNPEAAERRPVVVKVSNESVEVRPLSGYSFAEHLWLYQMEGWGQTRFSAVFLDDLPEMVGSVRSVRPIDTDLLIPMYDGLFVYSGASIGMSFYFQSETPYWDRAFRELPDRDHLVRLEDVPREGVARYHRLFAFPEKVLEFAQERGNYEREAPLRGLAFDETPPPGGSETSEVTVLYESFFGGRFRFEFDETSGEWLFYYMDRKERDPVEMPEIDYLTGEQLSFDNIVILYAEHNFTSWVEDADSGVPAIDIDFMGEGGGYLLRDGQVYDITWEHDEGTLGQFIALFDGNGDVIPLRPGQTIFVTSITPDQNVYGQYAATITFE